MSAYTQNRLCVQSEQEFDIVKRCVLSLFIHIVCIHTQCVHCRALILSLFVFIHSFSGFAWYVISVLCSGLSKKFIWSIFHIRNSKGEFDISHRVLSVCVCLLSFIRSKFCYALCMPIALLRIFTKILLLCFLTYNFFSLHFCAFSLARSIVRFVSISVAVIVVVCSLYTYSLQFFFSCILFSSFFNMFRSCLVRRVYIDIHTQK